MSTQDSSDRARQSIYRFFSFEHFKDLIEKEALYFVTHNDWDDKQEGLVFKAMRTKQGRQKILNTLKKLSPDLSMPIFASLGRLGNCVHAQSWSTSEGDNVLWGVGSDKPKEVRIEVSMVNIGKLKNVSSHEIKYADFSSFDDELKTIINASKRQVEIAPLLLRKGTGFSKEQEVRLLSHIDPEYLNRPTGFMKSALKALHKAGKINKEQLLKMDPPKSKYIKFDYIDDFIKSVTVSPKADTLLLEKTSKFCEKNSLSFLGKSNF